MQRKWKTRVKGRDYYDFVWYLGQGIPVRLEHLEQRLRTEGWQESGPLTLKALIELLKEKFAEVDFESAKDDVFPFIRDTDAVLLWSEKFFTSLLPRLNSI